MPPFHSCLSFNGRDTCVTWTESSASGPYSQLRVAALVRARSRAKGCIFSVAEIQSESERSSPQRKKESVLTVYANCIADATAKLEERGGYVTVVYRDPDGRSLLTTFSAELCDDTWHHISLRPHRTVSSSLEVLVDGSIAQASPIVHQSPNLSWQPFARRFVVGGDAEHGSCFAGFLKMFTVEDSNRNGEYLLCWPFGDGKGKTVTDMSGNSHHGDIVGTAEWRVSAPPPAALTFNGRDSFVDLGTLRDFGSLLASQGGVTVEFTFATHERNKALPILKLVDTNTDENSSIPLQIAHDDADAPFESELNSSQWTSLTPRGVCKSDQMICIELHRGLRNATGLRHADTGMRFEEESLLFFLRDAGGRVLECAVREPLADGQWHSITWWIINAKENSMKVFVDGTEVSVIWGQRDGPFDFCPFRERAALGGAVVRGIVFPRFVGHICNFKIFHKGKSYFHLPLTDGHSSHVREAVSGNYFKIIQCTWGGSASPPNSVYHGNGVTSYAVLTGLEEFGRVVNRFSADFWVRTDCCAKRMVIFHVEDSRHDMLTLTSTSGCDVGIMLNTESGQHKRFEKHSLAFWVIDGEGKKMDCKVKCNITDGIWHHIVFTIMSNTVTCEVDNRFLQITYNSRETLGELHPPLEVSPTLGGSIVTEATSLRVDHLYRGQLMDFKLFVMDPDGTGTSQSLLCHFPMCCPEGGDCVPDCSSTYASCHIKAPQWMPLNCSLPFVPIVLDGKSGCIALNTLKGVDLQKFEFEVTFRGTLSSKPSTIVGVIDSGATSFHLTCSMSIEDGKRVFEPTKFVLYLQDADQRELICVCNGNLLDSLWHTVRWVVDDPNSPFKVYVFVDGKDNIPITSTKGEKWKFKELDLPLFAGCLNDNGEQHSFLNGSVREVSFCEPLSHVPICSWPLEVATQTPSLVLNEYIGKVPAECRGGCNWVPRPRGVAAELRTCLNLRGQSYINARVQKKLRPQKAFSVRLWICTNNFADVMCLIGLREGVREVAMFLHRAWRRLDPPAPHEDGRDVENGKSSRGIFSYEIGSLQCVVKDDDGSAYVIECSTNLSDGEWHEVYWVVYSSKNGYSSVHIDGQLQDHTTSIDESPSKFKPWSQYITIGAFNDNGVVMNHFKGCVRCVELMATDTKKESASEATGGLSSRSVATTGSFISTVPSSSQPLSLRSATPSVLGANDSVTSPNCLLSIWSLNEGVGTWFLKDGGARNIGCYVKGGLWSSVDVPREYLLLNGATSTVVLGPLEHLGCDVHRCSLDMNVRILQSTVGSCTLVSCLAAPDERMLIGIDLHTACGETAQGCEVLNSVRFTIEDVFARRLEGHVCCPDFFDGSWHHLCWKVIDATANLMSVFIDGVEQAVEFGRCDGPREFGHWSEPLTLGSRFYRGSSKRHSGAMLADCRIWTFDNTLFAHWPFQNSLETISLDCSGLHRAARLINCVWSCCVEVPPRLPSTIWNLLPPSQRGRGSLAKVITSAIDSSLRDGTVVVSGSILDMAKSLSFTIGRITTVDTLRVLPLVSTVAAAIAEDGEEGGWTEEGADVFGMRAHEACREHLVGTCSAELRDTLQTTIDDMFDEMDPEFDGFLQVPPTAQVLSYIWENTPVRDARTILRLSTQEENDLPSPQVAKKKDAQAWEIALRTRGEFADRVLRGEFFDAVLAALMPMEVLLP